MKAHRKELADYKKCLQCGYDLRGLAGRRSRCAECGSPVDPRTLVIPAWRWGQWPRVWNMPFFIFVFLCGLGVLSSGLFIPAPHARFIFIPLGLLITGGMLWAMLKYARSVRGRAEGRLVVFRKGVGFAQLKKSPHGFALRDIGRFRVRRIGVQHWRVKLSLLGGSVDVVIKGDRRRMAAIRAVLKQRMGHIGITGWGTRRRNRWKLPPRQGGS